MESTIHGILKRLCARLLHAGGCAAVAAEVRCPASRYRADVAGYLDPLPRNLREATPSAPWLARSDKPRTIFIECKQARSDFLRDTRETPRLLSLRERLDSERRRLEQERIRVNEPQLRRSGAFLFESMEEWEYSSSRLATYRTVLRDLRRIDADLHGGTKFWAMARYAVADHLYLAAPGGMITSRELPPGWGLIEFEPRSLSLTTRAGARALTAHNPVPARLAVRCDLFSPRPERHARLLRNIAAAATRDSSLLADLSTPTNTTAQLSLGYR